jgi:hypothetical protein
VNNQPREVTIDTGARAWVYVSGTVPASVLRDLDARGLELISACTDEPRDVERLMASCSGVILARGHSRGERDLRLAESLGLPFIPSDAADLDAFVDRLDPVHAQPYAFLAVRIHGDFSLIRAAITDAVERTLGIPCVWYDDPRVITRDCGVRERTQLMIRQCALFIADVTFSPNNPDHDSPNTAHEIGMALAYERPVLLTCQEPRRDLYFSAGDLHTLFWENEQHLNQEAAACFRSRYSRLGRRLHNLELEPNPAGVSGVFPLDRFAMDWARHYIAPSSRGPAGSRSWMLPDAEACLLAVRRQPAAWKAVWHPLGFMDIELFSTPTDFLRLHIWSELAGSYRSSGFSIHKHDWSMSSHVICGVVQNRVYEVLAGEMPTHRVYGIEYSGEVNQLRATEREVSCQLRRTDSVSAGATYTLQSDTFHDIAPPPAHATTATLVRGIRHPDVRNEVLAPLDSREVYETERVGCLPDEVRNAVDLVLAARRVLGLR